MTPPAPPARSRQEFTVLMAVYGGDDPRLFSQALASVFENTLRPTSVLVVADGPLSHDLARALERYEKYYDELDVLRLDKNQGLAAALNRGLAVVTTEWVARADADDVNLPDRFEMIFAKINDLGHRVDIIGSAIAEVDFDGRVISSRTLPVSHEQIRKFAIRRNPFNHMTTVYRTAMALNVGGYPDVYLREDYGLWAKMIGAGARCHNISEITVRATTGAKFFERRGGLKYALAEYRLQRLLIDCRLKNKRMAVVDCLLRGLVFCMPVHLRRAIYMRMLRHCA